RTRAQRAATAGRLASLGSDFAVLDDVRAWAAAAGVVVAAGWEGRAAGRRRLRVVAVDDVIAGAAGDRVTAEVSEQRGVVRAAGGHVIERAAEGGVVTGAARDGVDAAHPDQLVRARTTFQGVVAAQTGQRVVAGPAEQGVVIGSVGRGERFAVELVTGQHIRAFAAVWRVVAAFAAHDVVPVPGEHDVVAAAGHDHIVAAGPEDGARPDDRGRYLLTGRPAHGRLLCARRSSYARSE